MLKTRVFTAIVLLVLVGLSLFVLPESGFVIGVLLMCLVALNELASMYKLVLLERFALLGSFIALCFVVYFVHYDFSEIVRIFSITLWCFIVPLTIIFVPKHVSKKSAAMLGLGIFLPAFYAFVALHELIGSWQLVSIMAIAWIADIGAYFSGKAFGHHKLAKHISPGKTIEGALGGLVLVMIYLSVLKYTHAVIYLYDYMAVLKFGVTLTIVSILGDLFESYLKRIAGVKDSGHILPGHGGVFDRIDSLVAVVSIAFVMIRGLI